MPNRCTFLTVPTILQYFLPAAPRAERCCTRTEIDALYRYHSPIGPSSQARHAGILVEHAADQPHPSAAAVGDHKRAQRRRSSEPRRVIGGSEGAARSLKQELAAARRGATRVRRARPPPLPPAPTRPPTRGRRPAAALCPRWAACSLSSRAGSPPRPASPWRRTSASGAAAPRPGPDVPAPHRGMPNHTTRRGYGLRDLSRGPQRLTRQKPTPGRTREDFVGRRWW